MLANFDAGPAEICVVGDTIYTYYEKYPNLPEWFISHKKSIGEEIEPIYQMAYSEDNGRTWKDVK